MKNCELFCFKDTKNFAALFFVAAGNKKSPAGKCAAIRVCCKWIQPMIGWMNTKDEHRTHKHSHDSWILCSITCSLENNAFSVLHYVVNVALHYYMLHRCEFFSAPGTVSRTALLGLRLSASRLCEDACLSNYFPWLYYVDLSVASLY